MKQTINSYQFINEFKSIRPNNFSYEGLNALYDYFWEIEESTGEEIELDVIAICCDFTEYEDLKEFRNDYGNKYKTFDDIEYETILIPVFNYNDKKDKLKSFIIQNF